MCPKWPAVSCLALIPHLRRPHSCHCPRELAHAKKLLSPVGHPHAHLIGLSEEHGWGQVQGGTTFAVGDRVEIVPNHACTAVNTQDKAYVVQNGQVVDTWMVDARGRVTRDRGAQQLHLDKSTNCRTPRGPTTTRTTGARVRQSCSRLKLDCTRTSLRTTAEEASRSRCLYPAYTTLPLSRQ